MWKKLSQSLKTWELRIHFITLFGKHDICWSMWNETSNSNERVDSLYLTCLKVNEKAGMTIARNQPLEVFCEKRCSKKIRNIQRKTPVPEPLFLKKRLWQRCFPLNFVKSLRTPCLNNTSGRLLLYSTKVKLDFT